MNTERFEQMFYLLTLNIKRVALSPSLQALPIKFYFSPYQSSARQPFIEPPAPLKVHYRDMGRPRTLSCSSTTSSSAPRTGFPTISLKRAEAFGAFAPTSSASSSLLCATYSAPSWPMTLLSRRHKARRRCQSLTDHVHDSDNDLDPPASPTSSVFSIPSISRASLYDESTSPASASSVNLLEDSDSPAVSHKTDMNPILHDLEKRSRFCTSRAACSTCGKQGSDFPRCGKCGELWCSRSCRLRDGNKHICSLRT
ncbi:hypothetical protein PM082_017433 [Marasmius tenuissimus]|nr:hypothetical protein PM082_017433 [Marasmius tenuissimus]